MSWLHLLLSSVKMQAVLRLTILVAWLKACLPETGNLSSTSALGCTVRTMSDNAALGRDLFLYFKVTATIIHMS